MNTQSLPNHDMVLHSHYNSFGDGETAKQQVVLEDVVRNLHTGVSDYMVSIPSGLKHRLEFGPL